MNEFELLNDIDLEKLEIQRMIRETPRAGIKDVEKYHSRIIERLDSGRVIGIPGPVHRNLHQEIWMSGYDVYNEFKSSSDAAFNFVLDSRLRERFDCWYAQKYILRKRLTDWELEIVNQATKECFGRYNRPLEDLTEMDVFFDY